VYYDPKNNLFLKQDADGNWSVYFPERHSRMPSEDIRFEDMIPLGDTELAKRFSSALDLLDSLVDPLLDIGVCKERVTVWKTMMRGILKM